MPKTPTKSVSLTEKYLYRLQRNLYPDRGKIPSVPKIYVTYSRKVWPTNGAWTTMYTS